jgi:hypothetical protein
MTIEVTIDLETLGVNPSPVLLSLGAVKHNGTEILDKFHVGIDPTTCQQLGLKIDASTVMFWMGEKGDVSEARAALLGLEKVDLVSALLGFAEWFGPEPLPVWGNGASADNVWMRSAYLAAGLECPWPFYMDRCYRTMKCVFPGLEPVREGVHHDALADATSQATPLQAIIEHIQSPAAPDTDRLKLLLGEAATVFRRYERMHRAKGTPEGAGKADANMEMAEKIEAALA